VKRILCILLPFIVIFGLFFFLSKTACNYAMNNHPEKSVPFNHKAHISDFGAECSTCHQYYDDGRFKGIPEVSICFGCHASQNGDSKSVAGDVPALKSYKASDKPWGSYAEQADHVYFSHKIVMTADKMKCETCHGRKDESADTKMLRGKMQMSQCEKCHTEINLSNKCTVCHK
jgi:menaquinone reductase, multiheme cytochrome c subunit